MKKVIINEEQFMFLTKHKYLELNPNQKVRKYPKDENLLSYAYDLWTKQSELDYIREEVKVEVKQYAKGYKIVQEA